MSELSQLQEDVRYLRDKWDAFMKDGGPKCQAHDDAVTEVYRMKEKFNWLTGAIAAVVFLMPAIAWLISLKTSESQIAASTATVKSIVEQVIAKLATGG